MVLDWVVDSEEGSVGTTLATMRKDEVNDSQMKEDIEIIIDVSLLAKYCFIITVS